MAELTAGTGANVAIWWQNPAQAPLRPGESERQEQPAGHPARVPPQIQGEPVLEAPGRPSPVCPGTKVTNVTTE